MHWNQFLIELHICINFLEIYTNFPQCNTSFHCVTYERRRSTFFLRSCQLTDYQNEHTRVPFIFLQSWMLGQENIRDYMNRVEALKSVKDTENRGSRETGRERKRWGEGREGLVARGRRMLVVMTPRFSKNERESSLQHMYLNIHEWYHHRTYSRDLRLCEHIMVILYSFTQHTWR